MLKMLDISNYQADFDIAASPVDIIAIKATEGTGYESPSFQKQWKAAKAANKAVVAYHLLHPSLSAVAQGRFFLNVVEEAGLEGDECLALDHEETDGLKPEEVSNCAVAYKDWIQGETKCKLITYTFLNFAESGNCEGLGETPLWIADPSRPPANPRIPAPWKDWTFHQYGIVKGVDADIYHGDTLEELFQYSVLPKTPAPGPDMREVWITDGTAEHSTYVHESTFVAGFHIGIGNAEFRILR